MFNKEYVITGKHAEYLMGLSKDKSIMEKVDTGNNVFKMSYQVILLSALVGVMNNKKADKDTNKEIDSRRVSRETVMGNQDDFKYVFQMVMLANPEIEDSKIKVDLAFKSESDEKLETEAMEIFDAYVRGGLEILYDKFFKNLGSKSNKFEAMKDFIKEMQIQNGDSEQLSDEIFDF